MVFTVDMENTVNMILHCWHGGWGGPLWERPDWGLKHPLESEGRTRVSRSIFKLNVARGCPGVFPNWMSHAGVKEYFQIECRTRVSRSIFRLNVQENMWGLKGWTLLNTIDHYWTLLNTIERFETLLNIIEHYWTLLNTIEHYWTLVNTIKHRRNRPLCFMGLWQNVWVGDGVDGYPLDCYDY